MTTVADRVYAWAGEAVYTAPALDCWAWNNQHGRLSRRDSAMPGPWRGQVVPHMRHWQDLVSARRLGATFMGHRDKYAHLTEQIWLVAGTQSTKTRSFLYASLGYLVDQWPSPKALILPRLKDFKKVLDNRVTPFFEETPTLARHFPKTAQRRKSDIGYSAWKMDTCTVYMLCGELADDMRSFPLSDLILDEFDLLPLNCEGQGDPIELGLDRQKTWPRTKLAIGATTPTLIDGHGWRRLCSGSHERLLIRCPACGADQELHPDRLRWPENATPDAIKVHAQATWLCAFCPHEIKDDGTKDRLVAEAADAERNVPGVWSVSELHPLGQWVPSADFDARHQITRIHPAETSIRSGHYNSLYSQFISLSDFAAHELAAKTKGNSSEWITHLNGWRCEPSILTITAPVDGAALAKTATTYGYALKTCPVATPRLLLTLDQQGNSRASAWFPFVVRAYGINGESWLVDAGRVDGFEGLSVLEDRKYTIGSEQTAIAFSFMDGANGTMRVPIQTWAAANPNKRGVLVGRFWPDFLYRARIGGSKKEERNRKIITGAKVFNYHSNAYATELDARMRALPGSKKWNLPDDAPPDYLGSLTSEEQVLELVRMPNFSSKQPQLVWKPRTIHDQQGRIMTRTDNHWLDCEKMSVVGADILEWTDYKPKPPSRIKYGVVGKVI